MKDRLRWQYHIWWINFYYAKNRRLEIRRFAVNPRMNKHYILANRYYRRLQDGNSKD